MKVIRLVMFIVLLVVINPGCDDPDPIDDGELEAITEEPAIIIVNDTDLDIIVYYPPDGYLDSSISSVIHPDEEYDVESGVKKITVIAIREVENELPEM